MEGEDARGIEDWETLLLPNERFPLLEEDLRPPTWIIDTDFSSKDTLYSPRIRDSVKHRDIWTDTKIHSYRFRETLNDSLLTPSRVDN